MGTLTRHLTRRPDWQPRLHAWLRGQGSQPIQPGIWDCCMFGAGAIEAMTGTDLAADWRGRYSTFAGGRRLLRRAGYADHIALIAAHLTEDHVSTAMPGDIAIVPTEDGDAVGVFQGSAVYVLTPSGKPGFVPVLPTLRLFRVI